VTASYRARQLAALGAGLECRVHLFEAEFGLLERAPEEHDEDAAEPLRLSDATASLVQRLDVENVLAVENAGQEESTASEARDQARRLA
jgi:hypothetical protein